MTAITIDTLSIAKSFASRGFNREQSEILAESQAKIFAEVADTHLATKQDIANVERNMREVEYRLTIKMGGMLVVAVGVVTAMVKLV